LQQWGPRVFLWNGGLEERGSRVFWRFCFSPVISPLGRRAALNPDRQCLIEGFFWVWFGSVFQGPFPDFSGVSIGASNRFCTKRGSGRNGPAFAFVVVFIFCLCLVVFPLSLLSSWWSCYPLGVDPEGLVVGIGSFGSVFCANQLCHCFLHRMCDRLPLKIRIMSP
jgi:hypothetical protein